MSINVLKVAIDAQILPNSGSGGVETVLIGLISALGKLKDGAEEYIIIGPHSKPDWLRPHLGRNQRIVAGPEPDDHRRRFKRIPSVFRPSLLQISQGLNRFITPQSNKIEIPLSRGFYEELQCDVIHFPYQNFTLCALPMVYNPHDLQHLHYPQFFTPKQIYWRETIYTAGCHYAQSVVTGSQWIKDDIIEQYGIAANKIQVVPWGAPTEAIDNPSQGLLESVKKKYFLPETFALYPAMLWEHKNHLRLLESIACLRDQRNTIVNLVCTGASQLPYWSKIEKCVQTLNLSSQVQFLGMISSKELRAIYKLAQFVVVPTLFEAASSPVFEAWLEGIPVTCSNVTSLPEQTADAALLFDPFSVEAISEAIYSLATDQELRLNLNKKGKDRLRDFSWERTAKAYRAVYRRAAHRPLSEEDRLLLSWDWMRNSKQYHDRDT